MTAREGILNLMTSAAHYGDRATAASSIDENDKEVIAETLTSLIERLENDLASLSSHSENFRNGYKAAIAEIKLSLGDMKYSTRRQGSIHVTQTAHTVEAGATVIGYKADTIG